MSLSKIKSILFDMDGVILNSMPFHAKAWKRAMSDFNIFLSDIDVYKKEGVPGLQTIRQIYEENNLTLPGEKVIEEIYNRKHAYFEAENVTLFAEIEELLLFIKSKNLKLALVTGSTRGSMERSLPEKIKFYFDYIVCGDEVKYGKPHPEPYLKALKGVNFNRDEVLVVENAPMGIKSAKNAELTCFALETSLPEEYLSDADKLFKTHNELLNFLKKEFNK